MAVDQEAERLGNDMDQFLAVELQRVGATGGEVAEALDLDLAL